MTNLTFAEKAYLWRKRMKFTQAEAAEYCELLPPYKWKFLEYGKLWTIKNENFIYLIPEKHEELCVIRRRMKLNQTKMAKKLGISRQYLNMIENGKIANYNFDMALSVING